MSVEKIKNHQTKRMRKRGAGVTLKVYVHTKYILISAAEEK